MSRGGCGFGGRAKEWRRENSSVNGGNYLKYGTLYLPITSVGHDNGQRNLALKWNSVGSQASSSKIAKEVSTYISDVISRTTAQDADPVVPKAQCSQPLVSERRTYNWRTSVFCDSTSKDAIQLGCLGVNFRQVSFFINWVRDIDACFNFDRVFDQEISCYATSQPSIFSHIGPTFIIWVYFARSVALCSLTTIHLNHVNPTSIIWGYFVQLYCFIILPSFLCSTTWSLTIYITSKCHSSYFISCTDVKWQNCVWSKDVWINAWWKKTYGRNLKVLKCRDFRQSSQILRDTCVSLRMWYNAWCVFKSFG